MCAWTRGENDKGEPGEEEEEQQQQRQSPPSPPPPPLHEKEFGLVKKGGPGGIPSRKIMPHDTKKCSKPCEAIFEKKGTVF